MRVWRRSSRCDGGQCVEVAWPECDGGACVQVSWGKSSASLANGSCVEAGEGACGLVHVRDSKLGDSSPVLHFTREAWSQLVARVNRGSIPVGVAISEAGIVVNGVDGKGKAQRLEFTHAEWRAFEQGCAAGDFDYPSISTEDVAEALAAAGDPEGAAVVREGASA